MASERNALAELAERLYDINDYNRFPTIMELNDIRSAQRIVAELAKVSSGHWENICDGPPAYICDAGDLKVGCCIGRCRAIAEEGVER